MSGTETPSLVLPGDDDLNDLYQKVLVGFLPSPITPDCLSPVLSDTASEVLPPGQASANRMFFIFVDGNGYLRRFLVSTSVISHTLAPSPPDEGQTFRRRRLPLPPTPQAPTVTLSIPVPPAPAPVSQSSASGSL